MAAKLCFSPKTCKQYNKKTAPLPPSGNQNCNAEVTKDHRPPPCLQRSCVALTQETDVHDCRCAGRVFPACRRKFYHNRAYQQPPAMRHAFEEADVQGRRLSFPNVHPFGLVRLTEILQPMNVKQLYKTSFRGTDFTAGKRILESCRPLPVLQPSTV